MTRPEDARTAEAAGASYVGAVMVSGSPRCVSPESAREIAESVGIPLVAVVADRKASDLAELARVSGAGGIQLHGDETPELADALRELGSWELWKAVRVRSQDDILRALDRFAGRVDALLLDGWHGARLGGTGRVFPWEALETVRGRVPRELRIGIAGGLKPENVAEAVSRLRPDLVDVSSGVETEPGSKDPDRVRAFIESARDAAGAQG